MINSTEIYFKVICLLWHSKTILILYFDDPESPSTCKKWMTNVFEQIYHGKTFIASQLLGKWVQTEHLKDVESVMLKRILCGFQHHWLIK